MEIRVVTRMTVMVISDDDGGAGGNSGDVVCGDGNSGFNCLQQIT